MITKNNNKKWVKMMMVGVFSLLSPFSSLLLTSCVDNDDDVPMNRYTAEKMTAAQFLAENESRVGDFMTILKKSNYFAMLSTYGNYTVFAPNNDAIAKYMALSGYSCVDSIPTEVCDTLARTHIIKSKAWFTTDRSEGSLGLNMAETIFCLWMKKKFLFGNNA